MSLEEPTFDWVETADAVIVRLPAPVPEQHSKGCATAFLVAAALLALPVPIILVSMLVQKSPTDTVTWVSLCVAMIITAVFLWYALGAFGKARLPARGVEPSVLSVMNRVLKIERAGLDRGMDYSWELSEIADLRICAAAPDRIILSPRSLLAQALFPDEVIRFSVERQSGEVDDVLVSAPGRYWPDAPETRLRSHLGLATVADKDLKSPGGA